MAERSTAHRYKTWSTKRKYAEAVKKVVHENWTISETARHYGITRPRLSEHVRDFRLEQERKRAEALQALNPDVPIEDLGPAPLPAQPGLHPLGLQERRRVGTFAEFDRHYWGRWICPDCEVHHELPGFHQDIIDALEDGNPRVLINLPPYHAKSTLVTTKHTIYEIVQNPNSRTLIISKSLPFAKTFLRSIQELLTNPDLYAGGPSIVSDWGPFRSNDLAWNTDQIYVAGRMTPEKDPTVQVLGYNGQVYGRRADTIKCDDVATLDNQRNPARVTQMLQWFDQEVSNRIGRNGKMIWVGTRVHPNDIYSQLKGRPSYKVLRYPVILDESREETLWPDHFTFEQALAKRDEMLDREFQLVYQNVDIPGLGASFTPEMLEASKDTSRTTQMYDSSWRMIAGLDLAGGNEGSGYTAGVLLGIDLRTGKRFLVDHFNQKSMRAPVLKEQMFDWTDRYPIYEWRVENNGLQSNLVQYNEEIIRHLAQRGVRVSPHNTNSNKWDPQFGVESIAPLFTASLISVPWANAPSARHWQQLVDQLMAFPMGMVSDLVMAFWFAELGCRDLLRRAHMPYFNERMHVPERIKKRRKIIDFSAQEVRPVPLHQQKGASHTGVGPAAFRRRIVGRPGPHDDPDPDPIAPTPFVNVAGNVEGEAA